MKKKLLALLCVMTMALGMVMNVSAEESGNAGENTGDHYTESGVEVNVGSVNVPAEALPEYVKNVEVAEGSSEALGNITIGELPIDTAKLAAQENQEEAKQLASEAIAAGNGNLESVKVDIVVNAMVDVTVENEVEGQIKLSVNGVTAGSNVLIFHLKDSGEWEVITPDSIGNGEITFTMTSYSPIVVATFNLASNTKPDTGNTDSGNTGSGNTDSGNTSSGSTGSSGSDAPAGETTSPKTGDPLLAVEAMTVFCGLGAVYAGKKRR